MKAHLATLGFLAAVGLVAASCAQERMDEAELELDELAATEESGAVGVEQCAGGDDADCLLKESSDPELRTLSCGFVGAACIAGADCCVGACVAGLCGRIALGYNYGLGWPYYGLGYGLGLAWGPYGFGGGYGVGWGSGWGPYGLGVAPAACGAVGVACVAAADCCGGACTGGFCI